MANPNGTTGINGCADPGPWGEGCDREACTNPVGGEHAPTCLSDQDLADREAIRQGNPFDKSDATDEELIAYRDALARGGFALWGGIGCE